MTDLEKEIYGPWAIVTGASSGIGKEFARQLAASGINLVLVARRLVLLEEWGEELARRYGVEYRAVQADLTQPGFLDLLEPATRGLDIGLLVSNAGTGVPGEFFSIPEEALLGIVDLNAVAHLRLVHRYGRLIAGRARGGIVLVSAMGALQGLPYMANDAATKAYVISLGRGLNSELKASGVHVTVVIPGPTDTRIIDDFGFDRAKLPMKPMAVERCVAEGLAALKANRPDHLTGRLNRIISKLLPAAMSRTLNGRMLSAGLIDGMPRLAHLSHESGAEAIAESTPSVV